MTDPAVEAAQRVWAKEKNIPFNAECMYGRHLVEIAQEVLSPLRELHKPSWDNCINACCSGEQCKNRTSICDECEVSWPCATSKLVYTDGELNPAREAS